ncbi:tripeptidyl peptidase SED3 [Histoplasma capsulatum]|uniref:tripeptidyl-peptidase II n=1 Tax=Ajellomyces capsulatus TaxID=5037 RepID=A0A8A1M9Z4_AJECA|nr:tripeptidyl peptidase SED3 [Histoplasma capsulatum]
MVDVRVIEWWTEFPDNPPKLLDLPSTCFQPIKLTMETKRSAVYQSFQIPNNRNEFLKDVSTGHTVNNAPDTFSHPLKWSGHPPPKFESCAKFMQENGWLFEQAVLDLSTPGHPNYGQYMKRDQVQQFLKPLPHVSESILLWLQQGGVPKTAITDHGDWVNFKISVAQAESLLRTKFYYFSNLVRNVRIIRTLEYCVPPEISPYVHMIQPTTRFGQPKPDSAGNGAIQLLGLNDSCYPVNCSLAIAPSCIREIYNMGNVTATPDPRNKLGVSGYLEQYARYSDLDLFFQKFVPELKGSTFHVVSINGGLNHQNSSKSSMEASLDVQYTLGLSNATTVYYTTGGLGPMIPDLDLPDTSANTNEPYLDQLHYLLSLPDEELPAVLTTSYGENERSVPEKYANSTCNLFAQLGARGVSVLFSSGDSGPGSACQTNDGTNTTRFDPIFPAVCPFLTSVGGTQGVNPETAAYFSSGGFSDRYPRPAYQDEAVSTYLGQLGSRWAGLYNPAGRGFPDVAAQSAQFHIVDHGEPTYASGTSASAPVFAAVVAILNSIRLAEGKPVLGFLNPLLYSLKGAGLNDIVDGYSEGCTGFSRASSLATPYIPRAGWNATVGWDPVTGLGTPNFAVLAQIVKAL